MTRSTLQNKTIHGEKIFMVAEIHEGLINDFDGPYTDYEDALQAAQDMLNVGPDVLICEVQLRPVEQVSASIKRKKLR